MARRSSGVIPLELTSVYGMLANQGVRCIPRGITKVYGPDGNLLWENMYGDQWENIISCVEETSDGGFILGGWTDSDITKSFDGWLIRTDNKGTLIWEKNIDAGDDERFNAIDLTLDGGFILTGYSKPMYSSKRTIWLVKF